MSPHVRTGIAVDAWARKAESPGEKLRAAVERMVAQGVKVTWGEDAGVVPCPYTEGWCIDRRPNRLQAVSLVGAVLLATQPKPLGGDEELSGAAARGLGTSFAWMEGAADGFDMEPATLWIAHPQRRLYLAGLEEGIALRHAHSHRCHGCDTRLLYWEPEWCDGCRTASED